MDIRNALFKIYWKIQHLIAPGLKYSQSLYEDVLESSIHPEIKWLDLGCGHQLLPPWRSKEEKKLVEKIKMIVGIDYDLRSLKHHKNISLRTRGDITILPFKDSSFDLTSANMVIEHLDNPEVQFKEINRILRPGGIFIFHTPNLSGYATIMGRVIPEVFRKKLIYLFQGRLEDDVFDTHYKANTKSTINCLAEKSGFDVAKIKMIVNSAQFVIIPPLVILELIWIRLLMTKPFKPFRTNIIVILKKPKDKGPTQGDR